MYIDLNADVAESFGRWSLGEDDALIPYLTSVNVACGFHAGDPLTIRRVVGRAVEHRVAIGAQVSYPDLVGFGRRAMDLAPDELEADVLYQIGGLDALARAAGDRVSYVKPHGALYHRVLTDPAQAAAMVRAIAAWTDPLAVLTMAGGELASQAAVAGLRVVAEGYADRGYLPDGRLVPRGQPGALLTEPGDAAEQAVRLAGAGEVESLCLHGDTPGAPLIASAVRAALVAAGHEVVRFA